MINKKIIATLTFFYFSITILMVFILAQASSFNILDIESSSPGYILLAMLLLLMFIMSPLVVIFSTVYLGGNSRFLYQLFNFFKSFG